MKDDKVSLTNPAPPFVKRYLCGVLDNMRACVKTLNFSILESLIEEAQFQAERLEAGLERRNEQRWGIRSDLKDALEAFEKVGNYNELRDRIKEIMEKID